MLLPLSFIIGQFVILLILKLIIQNECCWTQILRLAVRLEDEDIVCGYHVYLCHTIVRWNMSYSIDKLI